MHRYTKISLFASWGGILFTSIILGTRTFTGNWIMNEPYPFFLWFPSWWVCFTLFFLIFSITAAENNDKIEFTMAAAANGMVAFLGSLLTGRYVIDIIMHQRLQTGDMNYLILFPWSLYAFVLFTLLFVMSSFYLLLRPHENDGDDKE
jgi:hypothetical protein